MCYCGKEEQKINFQGNEHHLHFEKQNKWKYVSLNIIKSHSEQEGLMCTHTLMQLMKPQVIYKAKNNHNN